jgi:hypothetical protein
MTPTREDLIILLTKWPQASIAALCEFFTCDGAALLRKLKTGDDFEPCAPRTEDGHGFAWRLSSLAVDPTVRAAALVHQRSVEQPPQRRQRQYNTGAARAVLPRRGDTANVLVLWLRDNPGKWTIDQIAQGRGCTRAAVREHLKHSRQHFITERLTTPGRPLVVSLKSEPAA